MICPKKVQDMCLFGMMCPLEAVVDDDGECADFIRSTLALMDAKGAAQPDQTDPVEAAEVQQERFAIVDEIFEGVDWRKDNPMLRGLQTPEMPCRIPMPEKQKPATRQVAQKAPLMCRIAHGLCGASASAMMAGCALGRSRVFRQNCVTCPERMRPGDVIRTGKTIRWYYGKKRRNNECR